MLRGGAHVVAVSYPGRILLIGCCPNSCFSTLGLVRDLVTRLGSEPRGGPSGFGSLRRIFPFFSVSRSDFSHRFRNDPLRRISPQVKRFSRSRRKGRSLEGSPFGIGIEEGHR